MTLTSSNAFSVELYIIRLQKPQHLNNTNLINSPNKSDSCLIKQ